MLRKKRDLRYDANDITEGVIWKQLLKYFFPILLGTFFQQLYNTVDAVIVGRYVGKEALAAVGGTTGPLINLIVGFFTGLASGATVIVSQFYGARREQEVSDTVHTAAALSLVIGVFLTVVGMLASGTLLGWMDTPADVLPLAGTYLSIYFAGMLPMVVYNIGSGIMRAVGDSRRPLYFLIIACLTNIVLDLIFVVWLNMGVAGVAWATTLSQLVSAVLVVITLCRSQLCFRLHVKKIRFHANLLYKTLHIGVPAGLQSVMYSISNVIIQTAVNGFGTDVLAAWAAYGKLDAVVFMVIGAYGVSITTFVGQNFGAGKIDRVHKSVRVCLAMTAATTVALCAVIYLLGEPLLGIFTDDPAVIVHGMDMVHTLMPLFITYISIEILSGALRGAGDTLVPTVMTLFGICVLRVIWVLGITPMVGTLSFMILSYPVTWTITSALFYIRYLRGKWIANGRRLVA